MSNVKVTLHYAGFAQLRNDKNLLKMLSAEGEAIAARAGEGFGASEPVVNLSGKGRAKVFVNARTAQAKRGEAKDRRLSRAVGGG